MKFLLLACLAAGFVSNCTVASAADTNNSVVRFSISYGARHFGDIDVELFDTAKPVTVSNFLYYVQSGAYDRSFIHRCIPGFIMQGGGYTVPNPYVFTPLSEINRVPEGPPITNEFNVGPRLTNTFGTIAMARVAGETNSATSDWFFNLGNNNFNTVVCETNATVVTNIVDNNPVIVTNYVESCVTNIALDFQDGGFTVFGRVKDGMKYINFFNSLRVNQGIMDVSQTSIFYNFIQGCEFVSLIDGTNTFDSGLTDLPVAFYTYDCLFNSDLFTVKMIELDARDVSPPKVAITYPPRSLSITNETITVTGTASDNRGVSNVWVYADINHPVAATINGNTWFAAVTNFPPGTNSLLVEAFDDAGNSRLISSTFFFSVPASLAVSVTGSGTGKIIGPTNGQVLELGRNYSLSAIPDRGNFFHYWSSPDFPDVRQPAFQFEMRTNLSFTARFTTNLFPDIKGTYTGLFYPTNAGGTIASDNSGFITLTITDQAKYTASLLLNGRKFPFKGTFEPDGTNQNSVIFNLTNQLLSRLSIDLSNGTDQITGTLTNFQQWTVTNSVSTNSFTNNWVAAIRADRAVISPSLAGKYTLRTPADAVSTNGPVGDGYGTATISTKGAIAFSGSLADGTKVAQKVPVSKDGYWPFHVPLYKGKGSILSWVRFNTNGLTTDLSSVDHASNPGPANWFKLADPKAKYFPLGFTNESFLEGSRYASPTTNRVLNFSSATVGFTNGNLAADFAESATLELDNKLTYAGPNQLKFSLTKSSGLFSGSVLPPGAAKPLPFRGVVLQKQNFGSGYFLGTNASGQVYIAP